MGRCRQDWGREQAVAMDQMEDGDGLDQGVGLGDGEQ